MTFNRFDPRKNFSTWLENFKNAVVQFGDEKAIIDPAQNKSWTYKEVDEISNKLFHAFKNSGLRKNQVVMGAFRNCPEFVFTYVAARKAGSIFLAANASLAATEMATLIDHNKPTILLYSANITDVIVDALKLCRQKPKLSVLSDNIECCRLPQSHIQFEDYIKSHSSSPAAPIRTKINREVLRLCTSGTTSLPKTVPLTELNEVYSCLDVISNFNLKARDISLHMTPWFHRGGCHAVGITPCLYTGACVIVLRTFCPKTTLELVEKYSVSFLIGAPANAKIISKQQKLNKNNLSSLKGLVTMGSALSRQDCLFCSENITHNIFNGYGTTESFWNTILFPGDIQEHAGSSGRATKFDEVRIIYTGKKFPASPDNTVPKDNVSEGEIIIRSPLKACTRYFRNHRESRKKFHNGWLYTGDIGTWDKDSFITVKGRIDDMMIVSGENIFPVQIEDAIETNPKVAECIVTSVPDKVRGQAVAAYIVRKDNSLSINEISDFCKNSKLLSRYKHPRYYAFVDSIPRTSTGKKNHRQIKIQAEIDLASGKLKKC